MVKSFKAGISLLIFFISNGAIGQTVKTTWSEPDKGASWSSQTSIPLVSKDAIYVWEKAYTTKRTFGFAQDDVVHKLRKYDHQLNLVFEKEIKKENADDFLHHEINNSLYLSKTSFDKKTKVTRFLMAKLDEQNGEVSKWVELGSTSPGSHQIVEYNVGYNKDSSKTFMAFLEKSVAGERLVMVNFDESLKVLNTWKASSTFPLGVFDITSITQTGNGNILVAGNEYKIVQKVKKNNTPGSKILEQVVYQKKFDEGDRQFVQSTLKYFDKSGNQLSISGLDEKLRQSLSVHIAETSLNTFNISGFATNNPDSLNISDAFFITLNDNSHSVTSSKSFPISGGIFSKDLKGSKNSRKIVPKEGLYNPFDSSIYLVAEELQWNGERESELGARSGASYRERSFYARRYMNGDLFVIQKKINSEGINIQKINKVQQTYKEYPHETMIDEELVTFFAPASMWSSALNAEYYTFAAPAGLRFIYNDNGKTPVSQKLKLMDYEDFKMRNSDCYYVSAFNNKPLKKIIFNNSDDFIAKPRMRTGKTFLFLSIHTRSLGKNEIKLGKIVISEISL